MDQVKIEYYGHSCFRLSYAGQRIVLDPYGDDTVPGLPKLRTEAEFVFCSHGHRDHNAAECVKLHTGARPEFGLTELETDHDDVGGTKRGKNIVRIFTFGSVRIAHLGDLGRLLTAQETQALRGLDVLMIPVGGFFTIDAAQAQKIVDELQPETIIPMHYRSETSGYDVIAPLEDFLGRYGDDKPDIVPLTYGGHIDLEK